MTQPILAAVCRGYELGGWKDKQWTILRGWSGQNGTQIYSEYYAFYYYFWSKYKDNSDNVQIESGDYSGRTHNFYSDGYYHKRCVSFDLLDAAGNEATQIFNSNGQLAVDRNTDETNFHF